MTTSPLAPLPRNPLGNSLRREPKDTVQITTWNVQGIISCNSAAKEFGFRKYIEAENAHVVVLTEVRERRDALEQDEGFEFLRRMYPHRYWTHLCAVLSKIEPVGVTIGFPEGNNGSRSEHVDRAVTLEFKSMFLIGTYVPNSGGNGMLDKVKPVIWAGDFNVVMPDVDKPQLSLDLEKPTMCFTSKQPGTLSLEIEWHKDLLKRKPGMSWIVHAVLISDHCDTLKDPKIPARSSAEPIFVDVWRLIHPPTGAKGLEGGALTGSSPRSMFRLTNTIPRTLSQSTRSLHSSRFALSSAQHPGKSGLNHLENPSLSEEAVHAERHGQDPLSPSQKASSSTPTSNAPMQGGSATDKAADQAKGAWDKVKDVASQVKDKVEKATK
ncbi:hypothetical protein OIO90_003378 [Microbotryomycetes sp. JL221]|nr:hypothetical protein OIO90_003378 [Microbotryomycetes sp. JL221]